MPRWLRWVLIPLVALVFWTTGFMLAANLLLLVEWLASLLPVNPDNLRDTIALAVFNLCLALSAALAAILGALLAPSHPRWVAVAVFVLGAAFTLAIHPPAWPELISMFVGGALAVVWVFARFRRS